MIKEFGILIFLGINCNLFAQEYETHTNRRIRFGWLKTLTSIHPVAAVTKNFYKIVRVLADFIIGKQQLQSARWDSGFQQMRTG